MLSKTRFLDKVRADLVKLGHTPHDWVKSRWGFYTTCQACGAHTALTVSRNQVREFPDDTCQERQASVAETTREWRISK